MKKEPIKSTKPVFNTMPETIAKLEEEITRLKEYVDKLETQIKKATEKITKQETTILTIKNQKAKSDTRLRILQEKYDMSKKEKTSQTEYLKKIQDMFGGMVDDTEERPTTTDLKPDEPIKDVHKMPPRY